MELFPFFFNVKKYRPEFCRIYGRSYKGNTTFFWPSVAEKKSRRLFIYFFFFGGGAFFKAFSWEVTLGDFTVKDAKFGRKIVI